MHPSGARRESARGFTGDFEAFGKARVNHPAGNRVSVAESESLFDYTA
jgi:hypothetical protein